MCGLCDGVVSEECCGYLMVVVYVVGVRNALLHAMAAAARRRWLVLVCGILNINYGCDCGDFYIRYTWNIRYSEF